MTACLLELTDFPSHEDGVMARRAVRSHYWRFSGAGLQFPSSMQRRVVSRRPISEFGVETDERLMHRQSFPFRPL